MPARADRRGPPSSGGREAHEAFPAGSQEEGSGAARHTGAHTWTSPWADLSSADPGMSPESGISASRDAPGGAPGARLRSHAQYPAGFDPARAQAAGPKHAQAADPEHAAAARPEPATEDGPKHATADDPQHATEDGPQPATADDPQPAAADDPQRASADDPQRASADDRNRAG